MPNTAYKKWIRLVKEVSTIQKQYASLRVVNPLQDWGLGDSPEDQRIANWNAILSLLTDLAPNNVYDKRAERNWEQVKAITKSARAITQRILHPRPFDETDPEEELSNYILGLTRVNYLMEEIEKEEGRNDGPIQEMGEIRTRWKKRDGEKRT